MAPSIKNQVHLKTKGEKLQTQLNSFLISTSNLISFGYHSRFLFCEGKALTVKYRLSLLGHSATIPHLHSYI